MKENIILKIHTKKDLQKMLMWAKAEIKQWQRFIKLVEKRIKNKVYEK